MASPKGTTRSPARKAPEVVPARPPYVSASMEVLETLEIENTVSALEARMDSLEIDLARQQGTRDDDARRMAGDMAVMKARVEDALNAFAVTAEELRTMARTAEKRIEEIASTVVSDDNVAEVRSELRAGIEGMMAGVGDALGTLTTDVGGRIEELASRMQVVQDAVLSVVQVVEGLAPVTRRLADLETAVADLTTSSE